ncbi:Spy/CpxP family protein refolding chaperone [Marinilabilia salmonicolor]|jgi:Spy/CpxP family protein refolding chaperone|uniref:Spy/CpxP family protein refolding chaperone n=1 Tax=Marinilabilia salmonicolor TaxID=989 RepID=UPI000D064B66|nr:periplasmic heavy metal sensor [Marinilabilia salmonicolor]PRZ01412.1 Spy/CpxP family protein refolding chaperone [Marinilabilia salmonicolor]
MNKRQIIFFILISVIAFVVGWGLFQWWYSPPVSSTDEEQTETVYRNIPGSTNPGVGAGFNQMVSVLEFSEEQIADFSQIERQYRQQAALYLEQLDSIDLNILDEIKKEHPDENRLDELAEKSGDIQFALKKATSDHFLQIKELCTPDQRERFNEVISGIDRYRRGRGPGRGPGNRQNGQRRGWRNR